MKYLSLRAVRVGYHRMLKRIGAANAQWITEGRTLAERAYGSWEMRAPAKWEARAGMDAAAAAKLPPPQTFGEMYRKYYDLGLRGDDIYRAIIHGSTARARTKTRSS